MTHTPDPPGGSFDRAPDGRPNGILRETAINPVSGSIPVRWNRANSSGAQFASPAPACSDFDASVSSPAIARGNTE